MAIDYFVEAGIGFIVLNRPPANAYDRTMVAELRSAAERAAGDPAVRIVVVKSASPKFFCSGADISTLQGATPAGFANFLVQAQAAVDAIAAAPKLFIAAIAGHCIGGGLEIALGCDLRFASTGGYKLGLAEVNLGLSPGMGGTQRLARLVPKSRALHIMVTGEMLTPEQALADGIVDRVIPAETFDADVMSAAKKLATGPTMAQGYIKLSVNRGLETSLTEGLAIERAHQSMLFGSADAAEGLAAFLGKRPANFTGGLDGMAYQFLTLSDPAPIRTLTLARPESLNAWHQPMRDEMRDAIAALVGDDELRVLVITGNGRAFSAGEDIRGMKGLAEIGTRGFRRVVRAVHNVFDEIEAMEVPVLAAINGVAAGGGLELALSCDFRFAATTAKLGFPENNVGLIPGSGGCSRLVKLVGLARAKRLVMTGEMVTAERALALGLVEELHPPEELLSKAMEFAELLASKAPLALGLGKLVLNKCLDVDLDTGRNFERLGQSILKRSADHEEGARAFVEKRKPQFAGR